MTDNRTTELREKLRELGIEFATDDFDHLLTTIWWVDGIFAKYLEGTSKGCWCEDDPTLKIRMKRITPEQAIAATLGSDASVAQLAERLRGIADEMRNVGASSMKPHDLLACYAREVDKVADSLKFAATLGNGTCRNEWAEFGKFRCSECWTQVDSISTNTTQPMPIRYCPNCGRRVER